MVEPKVRESVSLTLTAEDYTEAHALARKENRSFSNFVARAVHVYIELLKAQATS